MKNIIFEEPGIQKFDIFLIEDESEHQIKKHGIQKRSPFEWLAYLTEEVGELAEAICEFVYRDGGKKRISEEAISVATLALKISKMAANFEGDEE